MTQLNHVPIPTDRPKRQVASPFYAHPYGGIARDIHVTREGFMRFFELDEFEMRVGEEFQGKIVDRVHENVELLGYVGSCYGKRNRTITVIDRDPKRVSELLRIAPYLWEGVGGVENLDDCDPHGIPRPMLLGDLP